MKKKELLEALLEQMRQDPERATQESLVRIEEKLEDFVGKLGPYNIEIRSLTNSVEGLTEALSAARSENVRVTRERDKVAAAWGAVQEQLFTLPLTEFQRSALYEIATQAAAKIT